ncbi:hypothetical protein TWF696_008510 [Orbilia brochopaga]|uniref:F-box domain-containing protein n=1 Tax=Orbilia brochopaga TaxID=3140254 RepID=A0AAV9UFZ7_9PEZI
MPTGVTSLPVEILHEILSQEFLDEQDLCNASLACKAFTPIAQEYLPRDGDIMLRNSDAGQLVSMLRNLLANERFRGRFTNVEIDWGFRLYQHEITTPPPDKYKWTSEERAVLAILFDENNFHKRWRSAVEDIVEPAALLVPIICQLTNLRKLHIGKPNTGSIEMRRIYSSAWTTHLEELIERVIPPQREGDEGGALDPKAVVTSFPKALRGLTTFTRAYYADDDGFNIDAVIPIFLLPNMEVVELTTFGGNFNTLSRFDGSDFRCPVKRIEFHELECWSDEVARFFRFCEALEVVNVSLVYIGVGVVEDEEELEEAFSIVPMQEALMEKHKGTLKEAMLEAERNYWWFKRRGSKVRGGWKPTWWGNEDWDD